MAVVLINPFAVPPEQEAAFLEGWKQVAEQVKHAPGFLGTRLHRSLDPKAEFRFVNIAHWDSEAAWRAAFAGMQAGGTAGVQAHPALYEVAVEY